MSESGVDCCVAFWSCCCVIWFVVFVDLYIVVAGCVLCLADFGLLG